jgi:aminocarboxymuconate-semialdehyde decarboxylase
VIPGIIGAMVDYPFDTTRAAMQMVLNGVLDRYPNVRVILCDGGGAMPYVADRAAYLATSFRPDVVDASSLLSKLSSFYFETALIGVNALPSLKEFAGANRILFGTGYPFASPRMAEAFAGHALEFGGFTQQHQSSIFRTNAQALFPNLTARIEKRRTKRD